MLKQDTVPLETQDAGSPCDDRESRHSRGLLPSIKRMLLALRLAQIRKTVPIVLMLTKLRPVALLIRWSRSCPPVRAFFHFLVGYRRAFDSVPEATSYASGYIAAGHDHVQNAMLHLSLAKAARPSDYPILFYLDRIITGPTSLFDLGGNVGNLFYCYDKYLHFDSDLLWTVYDLPEMLELGRELASNRTEQRIRFTDQLEELGKANIMLASGSLHFFEFHLPDLLRVLPKKPKHLLINRSPVTDSKPVATVHDGTVYLVACQQIAREKLVRGLQELNYELLDSWPVLELSHPIPFYPEYSLPSYSGMYLKLRSEAD